MSFTFSKIHGEPINLTNVVFQAMGFASVCWDDMSGTGVFHSEEAEEAGEAVIAWINDNYDKKEVPNAE